MKTILIDLDGTLLHMDQDKFIKTYFGEVAKKFSKDFDSELILQGLIAGTKAMYKNDGTLTNEDIFWKVFKEITNYSKEDTIDLFEDFYLNEFENARVATSYTPYAKKLIDVLKDKGYEIIVATNPLFPKIATQKRLEWAGLDLNDFKEFTTYENYHYTKPNPLYFKEILDKFNLKAENCIMIGNDIDEDLAAKEIGLEAIVVTDNLINRSNKDIEAKFVGTIEELVEYFKNNDIKNTF